MISSVNFKNFKLGVVYRFVSRVISLVDKFGAEELGITKQMEKLLRPAFMKLDEAYKKTRGSILTTKINDTKKLLDNATVSLFGTITIGLKSSDSVIVSAAKNLSHELKPYKGLARKQRKEQVADTTNMLQVLKGSCASDVEKLGLGKFVTEIETLNDEIDDYESSRTEENTDKNNRKSEEARKEVIEAFRAVCKIVDVMILTDGDKILKDFAGNLNTIIREFNIYEGAQSENEGEEEDDKQPEEGEKPSDETTEPEKPTEPEEDKYPDAKLWHSEVRISESIEGQIFYITVEDKKEYYKLVDRYNVAKVVPGSSGSEAVWEKID